MDSEDSRDGGGDAQSSSSSSSSSSHSRSRRSSSSDHSNASKKSSKSHGKSPKPHKSPKSPRSIQSPRSQSPKSPSSDSQSGSPLASPKKPDRPQSPENLNEVHSDINSPENSMPASPVGPKSPEPPKSPSDNGSNPVSPESRDKYSSIQSEGPRTPRSPGSASSARSAPASPDNNSRPASPNSRPASPNSRPASANSRPASPNSQPASPDKFRPASHDSTQPPRSPEKQYQSSSSPSPDRTFTRSSPPKSPKNTWNTQETWRRHTKAEQKMVSAPRSRSRSESSGSSRSSSYNKRAGAKDTEEISEGEMESDQEDRKSRSKSNTSEKREHKDLNMSHEDLSDVSDLDSVGADDNEKQSEPKSTPASPDNNKVEVNGNNVISSHSSPKQDTKEKVDKEAPKLEKTPQEKTSNTEDGEEQLDFEAEEGECVEPKTKEPTNGDVESQSDKEEGKPGRRSRGSSLEEGEVSDEGERRPEEIEPRPVCRFFSRGVCTWGVSCRFLHPGVTDKGNYNMFDVVRGVPPAGAYAAPTRDVPPPESAWERGLRTAKEMLRVANKRKEQDMDFEEKKLHLSVGGAVHDPDAELAYVAAAVGASPPRAPQPRETEHYGRAGYGPMYRGRFARPPPVDERERYYEYERYERGERPYERAPQYDERAAPPDDATYKRRVRSSREVIVQRAEVERRDGRGERDRESRRDREREGRGDDWADPWMRAETAARKRRPPSSDESYSSSSSSRYSSRSSRSPGKQKQRASSSSRHRLSPSVIVRERRLATARATAMNPPAPRRRAPSPTAARQLSANPPAPAGVRHKEELDAYGRKASSRGRERKKYSRSSSSGSDSSSSSSESESESRSSSTSGSSGAKRARHARLLNAAARPRANAKSNAGLAAAVSSITGKKESTSDKEMSKKRPADSPPNSGPAKKSVSRREELLKQLKAVEDAIARKRSKI